MCEFVIPCLFPPVSLSTKSAVRPRTVVLQPSLNTSSGNLLPTNTSKPINDYMMKHDRLFWPGLLMALFGFCERGKTKPDLPFFRCIFFNQLRSDFALQFSSSTSILKFPSAFQYSFYKNVASFTCNLLFAIYSNWSGISMYDDLFLGTEPNSYFVQ